MRQATQCQARARIWRTVVQLVMLDVSNQHAASVFRIRSNLPSDEAWLPRKRNYSITLLPGRTMALGLTTCNRNEYQEYFLGGKDGRCVGLTTLPPYCADCLEIGEPNPQGLSRPVMGLVFLYLPFYSSGHWEELTEGGVGSSPSM